jgi:hypothetical protein
VGRLSRRISGDNPVVVHYEITGRPGTAFLHALQTLLDLSTTAQLTMPDSPRITVLDVDDPEREWSNRLDTLGPDDGRPSAHWCQGATSSRSLMAESLKRALEDRAFSDPQQTPSCFKCKSSARTPKIEQSLAVCPIRAQNPAQLRSLTAIQGQPFSLHVRKLPSQSRSLLVFQAGHASSILATRSTASFLVRSTFSLPNIFEHSGDNMIRLVMCIS